MGSPTVSAADAAAIVQDLAAVGIHCWVMGGWGVDALLSEATRPHHDLDLLVLEDDLAALGHWLKSNGFAHSYDWAESQSVDLDGQCFATAFVAGHNDGRELDIHAIRVRTDGSPELATTDPWTLPLDTLSGRGTIDQTPVPCVSREAQRAMHAGYELPAHHVADLAKLGIE